MTLRLLAVAAIALLGGCTAGEPVNPNLSAPELLIQPRPDGNVTLYVHGAFGERSYDWIELQVDNLTIANHTDVFSLEERVQTHGFFATVRAGVNDQIYETRVRFDLVEDERALVAFLDQKGEWVDARPYGLPFGTILERRDVP